MMMMSYREEDRSTAASARRRRIIVHQQLVHTSKRQQRQRLHSSLQPLLQSLLSPPRLLLIITSCCCFYMSSLPSLLCTAWVPPLTAVSSPRRVSSVQTRPSVAAATDAPSCLPVATRKRSTVFQLEMAAAADSDGDDDDDSQMSNKAQTNQAKVKRKRAARLSTGEGTRSSSEGSRSSSGNGTDVDGSSNSFHDDEAEWKSIMAAFALYKAAYGNLKVPQRFIVPNMRPWPKPAWGIRLGRVVGNIRATGKYLQNRPQRKQQLDELGFLWQVRGTPISTTGGKSGVTLEQVYTALCLYREIYAHTQVPANFVVPDAAPWPESVRQLPLGRHVASLPKVLENPANAKWAQQFNKLDLLSKAVATASATTTADSGGDNDDDEDDADFSAAAETPAATPPPLAGKSSASTSDEVSVAELQAEAGAVDLRFERVLAALKTYKALYGDLLVPQPFCIPEQGSPEWPRETWGLRLGARVNAIRSQGAFVNNNPQCRQMLDDIEFVWSPPRTERRGRRKASEMDDTSTSASTPPSTAATRSSYPSSSGVDDDEDDDVASLFDETFGGFKEFSLDDEDGSPTWGIQAGRDALQEKALRQQQEAAKKEEDYIEFVSPMTLRESLKGATERAIEVGVIEGMTPNNRVIKGKRQKDIPWFNDDFGQDFVFDDVVEALTLYRKFYGDFGNLTDSMTPDFVVPTPEERTGFMDDDDDDDDDRGELDALETFNVGASARAARAIAKFEREGDLERSGDLITSEIERLQQELVTEKDPFSARAAVQSKMWPVTAASKRKAAVSAEWPEHLAGMALGSIVNRIRDGSLEVRHIPERKAVLDKLGFDWGEDVRFIDVPFEKAMCAMYAYYLVRGDMFVYEDFVMPDEDPWPQVLAGYEIGKAVKRLRELQHYLEAYHPEKVSLLRMIDFVWFPTTALSLDPDEPEMDSELLMLSAMGHPDYAKMIDIPMGLPDKIIADGPFFDSADPKNWWRRWHNWDYVKDYWYQQGRRDNAFVLRGMGYPRMAAEHEARYGPGLFAQMEETLQEIEAGIEGKSLVEKKEILDKLSYYRQEMLGCTDIHALDVEKTLQDLDTHMLTIVKDAKLDYPLAEREVDDELEDTQQEEVEYEEVGEEEEEGEDDEYEYYEEEEFELEDELGLDKSREKKP